MANSPNPDEPIDLPDSDSDDEVSDSHQTESKKKTSNVTSLNKPGIHFKRQRKLTSDVWANFEFLDKPDEQGNIICMVPTIDYDIVREMLSIAVVKHDLPFQFAEYSAVRKLINYINPDVKLVSRNTLKADVLKMFKREKDKLKEELSVVKGRISLTSDCWTSITTDGYMSLTAHFVDNQWNLQKKILNFRFLPPPHTGVHMSDHVYDFLKEWGIQKKIMCITLDNASSNDVFADVIKNELDLELENSDNFMHKMAARMNEKFAKYWTNFSIIMAVAVVLDPRFKYEFVEWAFKKVYGEIEGTNELVKFKERLDYLYGVYVTEASTTTPRTRRRSSRQPNEEQVDVASDSFMMDFDNFSSRKSYVAAKSDLQIYLEEPLIPPNMDPQLQDLCGKIMAMKVNDDVGDTPSPSPPQSAPESPAVMESQT
uniref:hAT-like transposase RNase-H fold domain-containing protein n=1 Tax=Chenopodium quinoa TaxID=63459 RepID=A0A803NE93_CHEQI